MNPPHLLICGGIGAGKSTLIKKLLRENKRPLYGFVTKKIYDNNSGESRVYINPANSNEDFYSDNNLAGICGAAYARGNAEVFDTIGVKLIKASPGGLLLMDELGFLESGAELFCREVLRALGGEVPVIAAVKSKDTPFLRAVKSHENARLYTITAENCGDMYTRLLPVIREWNSLA